MNEDFDEVILRDCVIRAYTKLRDYSLEQYGDACKGDQPYFKYVWKWFISSFSDSIIHFED